MRVYGDSISGNCHKVRWVLDLLEIPYEWHETSALDGTTRKRDFLTINPAGQVPAMVLDDGRTLAQSNAMILYLAEDSRLIPADPYDRGRMFEWLFWEQYSHEPYVAVRRFQLRYLNRAPGDLDPKLWDRGSAALLRLEDALIRSPYLVGEQLSLADIALVAYTRLAGEGGFDLSHYPAVGRWIARVEHDLGIGAYAGEFAA
ncbi:MAG TPA: glutathione S-transferase family protein [Caulobacteraceae bacterium]|nr:glutathione S-transferase family protein [Caulobacteraceae bacterium]